MKKTFIFALLIACLLTGCNKFENTPGDDEADCLVSFNFVGEITSSNTPLTKALTTDDLLMVQVKRGGRNFACGFFDRQDNMRLNLKKGSDKYSFAVCLVKNGKTLLGDNYSNSWNAIWGHANSGPFYVYGSDPYEWMVINDFWYNSVGWYHYYLNNDNNLRDGSRTGLAFNEIGYGMITSSNKYPPCEDWFYGEINDYSPNGDFETLNVDLKRVGFKLKYELTGVTDGEVTVKVYNSTKTFINKTTSTATYSSDPQFYAFYEARNAWLYADDYMENMTLAVSWLRGIGVTEDYGTKTIQIKRNCLNNIKISLGSNDQSAGMNMTVEAESTIGAEAVTIPVK